MKHPLLMAATLLLVTSCTETEPPVAASPTFDLTAAAELPLSVHPESRYLIDAAGNPFFYQADTPWMLFFRLPLNEVAEYIQLRKSQGFNALQVMLTGFRNMENVAGESPFLGNDDLGRPNERFFARVDTIVAMAAAENMVLALTPAWSGCCREGYAGVDGDGADLPLNTNGVEKTKAYGEYLGRRYGAADNVIWIIGGDNDPFNAYAEIDALARGLDATNGDQLMTYHAASTHSSTDVWPAETDWLDLSMVYTYFRGFDRAWNKIQPDVYEVSRTEWRKNQLPFFLGESTYEGEHEASGRAEQIRRQAWWAALSGATGHAYGSPNWKLEEGADWREVARLPGAASLHLIPEQLSWVGWPEVTYDFADEWITSGRGAYANNELAVAVGSKDGSRALIFLPTARAIGLSESLLAGKEARWLAAGGGEAAVATPGSDGLYTPPGLGDWLLLLSKN